MADATTTSDVKSDGNIMNPGDVLLAITQQTRSRNSSTTDNDDIAVPESKELYTERKWDHLDPFEYVYDKNDPGYVLIINQKIFKNSSIREGTDFDVEEIIKCFGRQGYNIDQKNVINDSTKEELLAEVNRVCIEELNDTNSLFVFVLSHGKGGNKFAVSDDDVGIEELVEPFLNVKAFENKPKIFIFQTCKTSEEERINEINTVGEIDVQLYVNTTLTAEPNLLLYCSTLEGDFSYRDKKRGSWFIQEFCRNIYTYGHREDILSILMRCNKCLAKNYYYNEQKFMNKKQTPLFISTLLRNFYINRSKDRYFYINKMIELRNALAKTEELKNKPIRRSIIF